MRFVRIPPREVGTLSSQCCFGLCASVTIACRRSAWARIGTRTHGARWCARWWQPAICASTLRATAPSASRTRAGICCVGTARSCTVDNERYERRFAPAKTKLRQGLAGQERRSGRYKRTRRRLARLCRREADCRANSTDQATIQIVRERQAIAVEGLTPKGMTYDPWGQRSGPIPGRRTRRIRRRRAGHSGHRLVGGLAAEVVASATGQPGRRVR